MDGHLATCNRVLGYVRKTLGDIPIQQLQLFLIVAHEEGVTMPEIGRTLRMGQTSVSKTVTLFSTSLDSGGLLKGHGLLRKEQDLAEPRRFAVYLTDKGRAFAKHISELMGDRLEP